MTGLPFPDMSTPDTPPALVDPRPYWEQRLAEHAGLVGVGYLKLGAAYNRWLYEVRRTVFRRLAAAHRLGGRGQRVLDVGSGTGFYVAEWLATGADEVVASDLTEVAVGRLRQAFPGVAVHQMDIGAPPVPGTPVAEAAGRFDVVSAIDMLFHIVDDGAYGRAISNFATLVRPGGTLVISEMLLHGERATVPHMVSRTRREVEGLLRAAGFDVVDRRPMFVLMNYPLDLTGPLGAVARLAWTAMVAPCALPVVGNGYGWLLGAVLAPLERLLTAGLRGSATTEILVCVKRAEGAARSA